jgi:hypothetical protein
MLVHSAQPTHADGLPKVMQLRSDRQSITIGQSRKLSPRPLLAQQLEHQVARVRRSQQRQQEQAVKLRGTPVPSPTAAPVRGKQFVDERIGNESGELFEQGTRAGDCKRCWHAPQLPCGTLPVSPNRKTRFFSRILLSVQPLSRIPEHPLKGLAAT